MDSFSLGASIWATGPDMNQNKKKKINNKMRDIVQASPRQSPPLPSFMLSPLAVWVFGGIFFHERGGGGEADEARGGSKKRKKKKLPPPSFLVRSRGRCIFGSTNFERPFFLIPVTETKNEHLLLRRVPPCLPPLLMGYYF